MREIRQVAEQALRSVSARAIQAIRRKLRAGAADGGVATDGGVRAEPLGVRKPYDGS